MDQPLTQQNSRSPHRWSENAVVYHIYPRSLQDSDGDGVGDLPGIINRLDYIRSLGVNALWLSPFYPSPMADFGYDVADYCDVHPLFGTLEDFRRLLSEANRRDMKVIIDLVPNHTSDEHEWFKQSRQSRNGPYADWYIWRDALTTSPADGPLPPNNWLDALTGRSAWEWEPAREQFYLHSFDVRQPDLNWSNPAVRSGIKDVMRFWLDMGVDGFRVDAVYWLAKEPLLSDDTRNPDYVEGEDLLYDALLHDNSRGWPAVYAYLSEMTEVLKEEKYRASPRFMITEAYPERHNPLAAYMNFYVGVDPEVAAPFNFEGLSLSWEAGSWRRFLKSFHQALNQYSPACIPSYAFGNHDQPRLASRLGVPAARSAAVMLLTLPGMVFIYYGEELGMKNVDIPADYVQDPAAKGDPKHGLGRDPERTPMQWSAEKNAGFSDSDHIWLPVAPDYPIQNVEVQSHDPSSFLSLYRQLGKLRAEQPALVHGRIEILDIDCPDILGYTRQTDEATAYAVLINFSGQTVTCRPNVSLDKLIVSSDYRTELIGDAGAEVTLLPHEAAVFALTSLDQTK